MRTQPQQPPQQGPDPDSLPLVEADPYKIASQLFDTRFAMDPNRMAPHQRNAYAETVRVYTMGEGIHSAYVLGNASALSKTAYPTGQVINYKCDAKVDPLTLTPESMHVLVMCKIIAANGQTLNEDFFKSKLASLEEAVPQYSTVPISNEIRNELDNTDEALWDAEMGDTGSYGVQVRRVGASSDYYIQATLFVFCFDDLFVNL
jgi:hypothetical protein